MQKTEQAAKGKEETRFGKWDSILHGMLQAHQTAQTTPAKEGHYGEVLHQEMISDADLRTKVRAWPHLAKRIIGSLPRQARRTANLFVTEVLSAN